MSSVNDSHLSAAGANVNNIEVNVRFGGQPPSEPAPSPSSWSRFFGEWLLGLSTASTLPPIVPPSHRGLEASVPGESTSPPRLQASLIEGPISIVPLEHAHMYERLALPAVQTREPSEIYVRQLYPHGHGYPCANPMPWGEPIQIGDIGVLESEGFDVLDNLHTLPDEFVHRNPVPAISVVHQPEYFVEGDTITGGVHRTVKMSNSAPAVIDEIVIHCPKEEGAVLAITSPAERWRMKRIDILRDYLCQNASRLFEFLSERHLLSEGTSICVVTGTVLSSSWATATYNHPMDPSHNALVLKRVAGNESQSPYFLWTCSGSAQTRTHGRQVRVTKDQCLFLKGFLLDASPSMWKARREAIKRQTTCQGRPDLQSDGGRGGSNSNNSQSGGSSTSQQGVETTNSLSQGPSSSLLSAPAGRVLGSITIHSIPPDRGSASDYPSYRINKSLLDLTKADFAITHDDDWREAVMNVANGPAVAIRKNPKG
ncbi:hypothetical protein BKA70DRAFT_1531665 [Coprinopsis sp. MPI-PUGE-AT-0042]|nr:hypothetical protein BKA70DRAFT_1531665 [Coprinopsis sp. MPI-PUGE-AT-0042]